MGRGGGVIPHFSHRHPVCRPCRAAHWVRGCPPRPRPGHTGTHLRTQQFCSTCSWGEGPVPACCWRKWGAPSARYLCVKVEMQAPPRESAPPSSAGPLLSLTAASSMKQQVWVVVVNMWTTGAGSAPGAGADASQESFPVMLSPALCGKCF